MVAELARTSARSIAQRKRSEQATAQTARAWAERARSAACPTRTASHRDAAVRSAKRSGTVQRATGFGPTIVRAERNLGASRGRTDMCHTGRFAKNSLATTPVGPPTREGKHMVGHKKKTTIEVVLAACAIGLLASPLATSVATHADHLGTGEDGALIAEKGTLLRANVRVEWNRAPAVAQSAWQQFTAAHPGNWHALWDSDVRVPLRIFGRGIAAPGTSRSAIEAERFALEFAQDNRELVLRGASISDFVVVSNVVDRSGVRSIGLVQNRCGKQVVGGQFSFRFKSDRLFVIASEIFPSVPYMRTQAPVAARVASASALSNRGPLRQQRHRSRRRGRGVDPSAGSRIWWRRLFASTGTRTEYPAHQTNIGINGQTPATDGNAAFSWAGGSAALTAGVRGPRVQVNTEAGTAATFSANVNDRATAVWDSGDGEFLDAQLIT